MLSPPGGNAVLPGGGENANGTMVGQLDRFPRSKGVPVTWLVGVMVGGSTLCSSGSGAELSTLCSSGSVGGFPTCGFSLSAVVGFPTLCSSAGLRSVAWGQSDWRWRVVDRMRGIIWATGDGVLGGGEGNNLVSSWCRSVRDLVSAGEVCVALARIAARRSSRDLLSSSVSDAPGIMTFCGCQATVSTTRLRCVLTTQPR